MLSNQYYCKDNLNFMGNLPLKKLLKQHSVNLKSQEE